MDPSEFFSSRDSRQDSRTVAAVEEKVVKSILKKFGFLSNLTKLKDECRSVTGSPDISLVWFQQAYPSFPVWLGAGSVPWVRDLLGELRERFTKTDLFRAWEGVSENKPDTDDRPVGLVFVWPSFGECILHNDWRGGAGFDRVPGVRVITTLKSLGDPFVIEPFSQYLQLLEWPGADMLSS